MSETVAGRESERAGMIQVGRRFAWPRSGFAERVFQAAGLLVLLGAVGLGLALTPSPTGVGTHSQLGLPPCGFYVMTGKPCPTCGVTTAFVEAAHGHLGRALVTQPFGCLLFVLTAGGALALVAALVARRSLSPLMTTYGVVGPVIVLAVIALASWIYKWYTL